MQKYPFFFDYIYYCVTKTFYKRDGKFGGTGILAIVMIQSFTVECLMILILRIFVTQSNRHDIGNAAYMATLIIFIGFTLLNISKYKDSYIKFKKHWNKETKMEAEIRGYLVFLAILTPIALFFF